MPVPDALNRPQADADRLGDRAASPVRRVAGRLGARQRQHLGHGLEQDRGFARLARPVPQEAIHALLGISRSCPHQWCSRAVAKPAAARFHLAP